MARLYNSEKEYAKSMPKTYRTDYQIISKTVL